MKRIWSNFEVTSFVAFLISLLGLGVFLATSHLGIAEELSQVSLLLLFIHLGLRMRRR